MPSEPFFPTQHTGLLVWVSFYLIFDLVTTWNGSREPADGESPRSETLNKAFGGSLSFSESPVDPLWDWEGLFCSLLFF